MSEWGRIWELVFIAGCFSCSFFFSYIAGSISGILSLVLVDQVSSLFYIQQVLPH